MKEGQAEIKAKYNQYQGKYPQPIPHSYKDYIFHANTSKSFNHLIAKPDF